MYKRLYLNREVPPDRRSYTLATHDIEGARPKHWVHPQKPFFSRNDPETHLTTQNEQYNSAMHEQLHYSLKERDPEWKYSKKLDYPDNPAKHSFIEKHQLLTKKEELPENHYAKHVFYPRNLNVKDIEGTEVGSLNTKFMKNWQLAQDLKQQDLPRDKPKLDLHYPYGDGTNGEEAMPEYLKHAREMAGKNRNKLRLINNMQNGGQVKPNNAQSIEFRNLPRYESNQPSKNEVNSSHAAFRRNDIPYGSLDQQYKDSRSTYENLKKLNYQNSPLNHEVPQAGYELPSIRQRAGEQGLHHQYQQPIADDYMRNKADFHSQPNLRRLPDQQTEISKANQLPSINHRTIPPNDAISPMSREEQKLLQDITERERYLRELDEKIRREKEAIEAMKPYTDNGHIGTYAAQPYPRRNNMIQGNPYDIPPNDGINEQQGREPENNYASKSHSLRSSADNHLEKSPSRMERPDNDAYNRYLLQQQANTQAGQSSIQRMDAQGLPQQKQGNQSQVSPPDSALMKPSKDMFRNTDEFHQFNRLSDADKQVYMAAFLRGQKGREFCLDSNNSSKLRQLNDFYAEYLGEQNRRRKPLTKDDYDYRSTVNHLKSNGIL